MPNRRPTSFDIAALAGVSQPTVSRALCGNPAVSAETRARVFAAAEQLNYKVDKNASGLRRRQALTLAALFFEDPTPDDTLINPFYLSMLGAMVRACAARGYDLLISFQQLSDDWHVDYEDSRKADGIILLGYGDYLLHRPRLPGLVGQRAAVTLLPHMLLQQSMVTAGQSLQRGQAQVGVAVRSGQIPADGLVPGDVVRVVQLPDKSAASGAVEAPQVLAERATVFASRPDPSSNGSTLLTLVVPDAAGNAVAAASGAGVVALVKVPGSGS